MPRILLVEDDELVRTMIRVFLEEEGHEVFEASDGKQMREEFDPPPDLIITDVLMPSVDGLELIMQVRRRDPKIKILAVSGGGQIRGETYLSIAQRLGAQHTLAKPFTRWAFLAAVRLALESEE
jgi:DNA-binding response OmpR family regulator